MATIVKTFTVASRGVGLPDYSQRKPVGQVPVGPVHTSTDVAELAARLGSPITHDRRGNVMLVDDFGSGIQGWSVSGSGAGWAVIPSSKRARSGGFSCKLTTGAVSGGLANIARYLPYPTLSKLGFELAFTMRQHIYEYHLYIYVYDGTNRHKAKVRYLYLGPPPGNDILQVDDNGTWTDLATGLYAYASEYEFHIMKLVADFVTKKYTRLIFDDLEYDISSYNLESEANPTGSHMLAHFQVVNDATAFNYNCYADDAIITQNEPRNI